MQKNEITENISKYRSNIYHDEFEAIIGGLGKSEITDEYCTRIIELYRIYILLTKSHSCRTPKAFEDLFLLKLYELKNHEEKQIDDILHMDDFKMKSCYDRIISWCNKMIDHSSESDKSYSIIKDKINNLFPSELRLLIIKSFYDGMYIYDIAFDKLLMIISSFNNEKLSLIQSLDVNSELNRLRALGILKKTKNKDAEMESMIYEVKEHGFKTNILSIFYSKIYAKALETIYGYEYSIDTIDKPKIKQKKL